MTKKSSRATTAQIEQRVSKIIELLTFGSSRSDIIKYAYKNWGIKSSAVDRLLSKAGKRMSHYAEQSLESNYNLILERWNNMYKNCRIEKDHVNAIRCLVEMGKIMGLYKAEIYLNHEYKYEYEHTHELGDKLDKFLCDMVKNGEMSIEDIADDWHDDYARQLFPDWERAVNK